MESSGNFSCTPFDTDHNNDVIRGTYKCYAATDNVQTGTGGKSGSSTSSSSGSKKTGAASVSKANGAAIGFVAALGGLAMAL